MSSPLRAALVVTLTLASCDVALGIHDVPTQDGADGSAVDAPFDTFVMPDGPFDGCNGGGEDCANGVDDNCNGLVDCADPVCQGASYACVAEAPPGWSPIAAFAAISGSAISVGCSGAYASPVAQGHAGVTVQPAQCGCSCASGQATGTTCGSIDVQGYSGTSCNAPNEKITVAPQTCGSFANPQASLDVSVGAPTSLGSCGAPVVSKTVPTPTWTNSFIACGYTAKVDTGGCAANEQCVQLPSSQFATKPCVAHDGDVACPGAPYTKKSLVTTQVSDTRDCAACSCNAAGGACAATVSANTGATCNGTATPIATNGSCAQIGGTQSVMFTSQTVTPASCTSAGGAATGNFAETASSTICCPP